MTVEDENCQEEKSWRESMTQYMILMFDAKRLKQHLEYNSFRDKVMEVEAIKRNMRGADYDHCLVVFMLRSILHGWTRIIGHHFTASGFTKSDLMQLIDSYLNALDISGLTGRAIV